MTTEIEPIDITSDDFVTVTYYEFKCTKCGKLMSLTTPPTPENHGIIKCPKCPAFFKIN